MTDAQRLMLVRSVHTAIYIVMVASVFTVLWASIVGANGWLVWTAMTLVLIESVIFVSSGMKCPLTALAARYDSATTSDTLLPERITRHTCAVFAPLILVSVLLLSARWLGVLR